MIRWLALGLWYAAIIFTSSLAATPETGGPFIGYLLNKTGHVLGYVVLGLLLSEALASPRAGLALRHRLVLAVTIVVGAVLASFDETRQTFVYGRTGQPSDVLIDTLGLSGGALLHQWLASRLATAAPGARPDDAPDDSADQRPAEHQHQQVHR
jgi:VanZ family protein